MNVYALQYSIAWEDKAQNQAVVRQQLEHDPPPAGSLVVLPELSCTGFTMRRDGIAENEGELTQRFYADLARQYRVYLIGGASWWGDQGLGRNMALVLNPQGELLGCYAKQHPFSYGGETLHYQAGSGFFGFDWDGCRVAPLICYDLRFPETFRHLAVQGVQLFVVIANWPSARVHHWDALLLARAIENQAYVLGVNRVGDDPKVSYPGSSRLIDPQGNIVARLNHQPGVLQAPLDLDELLAYRERFPALSDLHLAQLGL
jgi:predicted amidohydrolase